MSYKGKQKNIENTIAKALANHYHADGVVIPGQGIIVVSDMFGYKFKVEITCVQEPHTTDTALRNRITEAQALEHTAHVFRDTTDAQNS